MKTHRHMVSLYLLILWDEGDVEVIGRPSLGFAAQVPDGLMVNIAMIIMIVIMAFVAYQTVHMELCLI